MTISSPAATRVSGRHCLVLVKTARVIKTAKKTMVRYGHATRVMVCRHKLSTAALDHINSIASMAGLSGVNPSYSYE